MGAEPVGLLTAIELTLGGASVLLLGRLAAPSLALKALGLGPLGIETLQRRGTAEAIAAAEARSFETMEKAGAVLRGRGSKFSGHFAGLSLIRKDAQREPERRSRPMDQHVLEAMMADRARALGIVVRREFDVISFAQEVDGIDVEWRSPTGAEHIRCSYLVGCDGGAQPHLQDGRL